MMNFRYGTKIPKQETIDNVIFVAGSNQKTLDTDVITKIKNWFQAYVLLICDYDPVDCQTKMNKVPFQYLKKSGNGIGLINVNYFDCAYTVYTKTNMQPDIVIYSDHFVANLNINILYPTLDQSLD